MTSKAQGMRWWTEDIEMILPSARLTSGCIPRRRNSRTADRAHRNWPVRLTESTLFHCSSVSSAKGAPSWMPELAISPCTVPK